MRRDRREDLIPGGFVARPGLNDFPFAFRCRRLRPTARQGKETTATGSDNLSGCRRLKPSARANTFPRVRNPLSQIEIWHYLWRADWAKTPVVRKKLGAFVSPISAQKGLKPLLLCSFYPPYSYLLCFLWACKCGPSQRADRRNAASQRVKRLFPDKVIQIDHGSQLLVLHSQAHLPA